MMTPSAGKVAADKLNNSVSTGSSLQPPILVLISLSSKMIVLLSILRVITFSLSSTTINFLSIGTNNLFSESTLNVSLSYKTSIASLSNNGVPKWT